MSLLPKKETTALSFYNGNKSTEQQHMYEDVKYPPLYGSVDERVLLVGKPNLIPREVQHEVAVLIYNLFMHEHHHSHNHPKTSPYLPPEHRFLRHRNFYIWCLNQFRHWWKTSRLLVRLAGGYVYCLDPLLWATMAMWDVQDPTEAKLAWKQSKAIGQGGTIKPFLEDVHPFTRSIRIILAVARAWEARVDNRLYEVGLAEAFAFMGNRCSRYWARQLTDAITVHAMIPLSAAYFADHVRPALVFMGFVRAILPFAASFQGSRFGRQVTFNTYKLAYYRWKPTQSIWTFHEQAGNYQDTNLDPQLLALARKVAEVIGHGADPKEVRQQVRSIGFHMFGSGSSGYMVFRLRDGDNVMLLHIAPYGPSILDEMPRYILLERRTDFYKYRVEDPSDAILLDAATPRAAKVRGFTYSGAFFQAQEWASLKERYDRELLDYSNACKIMGTARLSKEKRNPQAAKTSSPPTNLQELKTFIRTGRQTFKQWRDDKKWHQIQGEVQKMAKLVAKYQHELKAPTRVILYLEGLDCAGKSSTGMLICNALQQCGYSVGMAQHNRPPTPEQRAKPWMDRIRFEYPEDMYGPDEEIPSYLSLVWDRGPAGDFVYGNLWELPLEDKLKRYEEFRTYDYNCRREGVLFFKCFFVTDRDSIAATLGKRLAHKKIARDLRAWLDANSVAHAREGLEEIEIHIDPTDFVAFNKYEENLAKFSEFARNTDYVGHVGEQTDSSIGYNNPWLVINTSNRHAARLNMMRAFRKQLDQFATSPYDRISAFDRLSSFFNMEHKDEVQLAPVPSNIVEENEKGVSIRAVFQAIVLFLLFYAYAYQTWHFKIDKIT